MANPNRFGTYNYGNLERTKKLLSDVMDTSIKTQMAKAQLEREQAVRERRKGIIDPYMKILQSQEATPDDYLRTGLSASAQAYSSGDEQLAQGISEHAKTMASLMKKPTKGTKILGIAPAGTVVDGVDISGKQAVGWYDPIENATEWLSESPEKYANVSTDWQEERDSSGNPIYDKVPGTNATRVKMFKWQKNPVTKELEKIYKHDTGGTEGRSPKLIGLSEKRLIKSYQDSFNRDPAIKTYKDQGMSLAAVNGIIEAARQGNQVSASALGVKMAKTMGEVGMLSESDVTRYIQAKSLDRSAADVLTKWIKGVPTEATLNDIQQIANVMRTRFTEQIQPVIDSYAQQMATGIGITEEEAINYLASEKLVGKSSKISDSPKPIKRTKPLEEMTDKELDEYEKSLNK